MSASKVDKNASGGGMAEGEVQFLMACLKNTSSGTISVNTNAVATELNYSNARSVGNRIAALKKKYDLPITASAKGTTDTPSPVKKAVKHDLTSPTANRVTKKRAPAKPRTKKPDNKIIPKKEVKSKVETDEDDEYEDFLQPEKEMKTDVKYISSGAAGAEGINSDDDDAATNDSMFGSDDDYQ